MAEKKGFRFQVRASDAKVRPPSYRRSTVGIGRLRKIAFVGGGKSIQYVPWQDPSWEVWAHASCRHLCPRDPDLLWDLHPPELWRDPKKKSWDPNYVKWLTTNRIPIMMQEVYADVPASVRYPFEPIITEFPRGYMTNHVAYMAALALQEGVTHVGLFGCDYSTGSEYGAQRGSAEYWLGVLEGRGVQVLLPPLCDLLNKPALLYGYESHPNGIRDKSYIFAIGPMKATPADAPGGHPLTKIDDPHAPPLRDLGVPPDPGGFDRAVAAFEQQETHACQPKSVESKSPTTTSRKGAPTRPATPPLGNAPSPAKPSAITKCTAAATAPRRRRVMSGTRMSRRVPA